MATSRELIDGIMNTIRAAQLSFDTLSVPSDRRELSDTPFPIQQQEASALPSTSDPAISTAPRLKASRRAFVGRTKEQKTPEPEHPIERLMTYIEAANALGISLRQFRRLVDAGKVAFVQVSARSPRIRPSELERFLNASVARYSEVSS